MAMAAIGGAVGGAGGGMLGSLLSYTFSKKLMEQNQRFIREMSSTQYQRTMNDMRKAGLNPMSTRLSSRIFSIRNGHITFQSAC